MRIRVWIFRVRLDFGLVNFFSCSGWVQPDSSRDSIQDPCKSNHLLKFLKEGFIERVPLTRKLSKENILLSFPRSVSSNYCLFSLHTSPILHNRIAFFFFVFDSASQISKRKKEKEEIIISLFLRFVCKHWFLHSKSKRKLGKEKRMFFVVVRRSHKRKLFNQRERVSFSIVPFTKNSYRFQQPKCSKQIEFL